MQQHRPQPLIIAVVMASLGLLSGAGAYRGLLVGLLALVGIVLVGLAFARRR